MSDAPSTVGELADTKFWKTKKICDWTFKCGLGLPPPLLEKLGPPVAAVNLEERPSDHEKKGFAFVARSEWFSSRRRDGIWADSLAELEALVTRAFNDQVTANTEVKWSDWIELRIAGKEKSRLPDYGGRENHSSINISWKILKRAKFPDGRDMVLEGNSLSPFPKGKAAGADRDCDNKYWQDVDDQYAYIAATPENLEAVHTLVRKIEELNGRLQDVLNQKSIAQTVRLLRSDSGLKLEDRR